MKNVIIRGPLLSMSGYGTHSRQVWRWAKTQNFNLTSQILPWGITPWYINPDSLDGLVGDIMKSSSKIGLAQDVSFQIQLPNEWDPNLAKYNVGLTAAVETDRCNPAWIEACNSMDKVIVPSTFTKQCLENSGNLSTEIEVVPEAFYDCILNEENEKSLELNLSTDFNFLIFGQITGENPYTDRKNTFFMIKWLCEEFASDKNVGIVIKTNHGRNCSKDRNITSLVFDQLLNEVRKSDYPKLHILHGSLEPEEIKSVYQNKKIKGLVAATRGEGYGLPLLEASASGLPVLATNWSGHLDFLNRGKFISFDYELKSVHPSKIDNNIFVDGAKWAEVKESDFKSKVRKFYNAHSKPKEWATKLSGVLKSEYSQESINKIYSKVLNGIL